MGFSSDRVEGCLELVSSENLGSASGVPLHPGLSNNAVLPTSSWWSLLLRFLAHEVGGCFGSYSSDNFGQRLRRTPAPRMVKQRRAADKFLVAVALWVFSGHVGGVMCGGDWR